MYEPKRVEKIEKIMAGFWQHVQEGDEIELGLVGDHLFPEEYKRDRPIGIVNHVQSCSESDDSLTMQVTTKDGHVIELKSDSVNPKEIWEFAREIP